MHRLFLLVFLCLVVDLNAQENQPAPADNSHSAKTNIPNTDEKVVSGPSDPKAVKTYADAMKLMKDRKFTFALDEFRKADKQDGGHCIPCEAKAYKAAGEVRDFKAQREAAAAMLANVTSARDKAEAHYMAASACLTEGIANNHEKPLEAADSEFKAALELKPDKYDCLYGDAIALAHLKQDASARERFQQFLKAVPPDDVDYARAQRFAEHPELARARVAPNFRLTSLDGKTVTLESLTGKVVLIDFWATWCGPCREALPHIQEITKKFEGQPLVVISISLDRDETKWKEFVGSHSMTWMQYRDGQSGQIAKTFAVTAIPTTFTIDADGVLQDVHVGEADLQGKIRKLVARANEVASRKTVAEVR